MVELLTSSATVLPRQKVKRCLVVLLCSLVIRLTCDPLAYVVK